MLRPSNKEIFNKVKQGKEAVARGDLFLINLNVIAEDAIELGYQIADLANILCQLLDEIKIEHYSGNRPPKKSYEAIIKDCELFVFKWKSQILGYDIYLKYCLKGGIFYLVSLHRDRP